ncbi:DUF1292 domain-containing protein [Laceyella tengchongensis]|uniref:DUF1292 domain-containing protein n=1 Tax=Laceyella tengchongensis TaxID=574699 RepID=UPI0012B7E081|nr:DUF1292 domain-containing protein [Laceyella tengchongensis]
MAEQQEFLMIPNEDGTEEKFEILYTFESDETGKKYMFVAPADELENERNNEDEEGVEVLAFRYTEEGDDITLEMIEEDNEQEWDLVEEMFNTLFSGIELEDEEYQ